MGDGRRAIIQESSTVESMWKVLGIRQAERMKIVSSIVVEGFRD